MGRGHFATVFKAQHKESEREVAVKLINKKKFQSRPKMLLSTIQEMGVLMALEAHVSCHDCATCISCQIDIILRVVAMCDPN